jgi:hypothetical protein
MIAAGISLVEITFIARLLVDLLSQAHGVPSLKVDFRREVSRSVSGVSNTFEEKVKNHNPSPPCFGSGALIPDNSV